MISFHECGCCVLGFSAIMCRHFLGISSQTEADLRSFCAESSWAFPNRIQKKCELSGKEYVSKEHLKHFLSGLNYPLYYLDFETFNTAIPMFDGLSPHQQVPFQYSLHVVKSEGSEPEHYGYLYNGSGDPRKEFFDSLKDNMNI